MRIEFSLVNIPDVDQVHLHVNVDMVRKYCNSVAYTGRRYTLPDSERIIRYLLEVNRHPW